MDLRRLVRGRLGWPRLETVARELARRYDRDTLHIRFLEADNWLSTPMVVDDEWFVKVISKQNSLVHAVFTTGRNLGAFSSGTEGFFGHFGTPLEMAEHELEATKRLRNIGLQAPAPVEAFEVDGLGVLVLEYLPNFHTLDTAPREEVERLAPELFAALAEMHDNHLAHGDLRAENVLVREDGIYFIDATNVNDEGMRDARAYDLACGLAALEPLVGPKEAVAAALDSYEVEALLDAVDFLDFVNIRPDHDFDAASLKGEIEKHAA
ncbi:RIO1 family regulatory kinase/ATPase [Haloferax sp. ATB1]|uniref:RIO1 family regulatory kinase/ATPase domain-containing protein n=1 Tax=Haloferax sp. ATB1 TaxID=1508454 RepID=UPI0005B22A62|nr:RIO1 family regulatory kinase/ATPase [Haloferax sp. ATB1]